MILTELLHIGGRPPLIQVGDGLFDLLFGPEIIVFNDFLAELLRIEAIVVPLLLQQLMVVTHLGNSPIFNDENAVSITNGRKAVGDDKARAPLH